MYIYFIVLFIVTIPLKIIESVDQNLLLVIFDKILSGIFISCSISIVITCLMRIWARFTQNIYKDESYLTHTLPVTKSEIFNSKIIASILSLILSLLVILVCIAIVYLNETTIDYLKAIYDSLVQVYNVSFAICIIIGTVLLVLLETICFMLLGIFGIVVGYRSNNHKTIKSIIIGIGSYGILSVISFVLLYFIGNTYNIEIIAGGFPNSDYVKIIGLSFIIIYLIYDLVFYFISKRILNKGVNVD